jgi:hypothetical protein
LLRWFLALGVGIGSLQIVLGFFQIILGDWATQLLVPGTYQLGEIALGGAQHTLLAGTRIFGTLGFYNRYGGFVTLVVFLTLEYVYHRYGKARAQLWLILGFVVTIFSFSRQSVAAFILALLLFFLITRRRDLIPWILLLVVGSIVAFSVARATDVGVFSPDADLSVTQRVILQPFSEDFYRFQSTNGRIRIAVSVFQYIWSEHLFLGLGPGTIGSGATILSDSLPTSGLDLPALLASRVFDVGFAALIAQYGFLGFGFFIALIITIMWMTYHNYRAYEKGLARHFSLGFLVAGGVTAIVLNLGNPLFEYREYAGYFWTAAGLSMAFRQLGPSKKDR